MKSVEKATTLSEPTQQQNAMRDSYSEDFHSYPARELYQHTRICAPVW
jgi:hypothetical protein